MHRCDTDAGAPTTRRRAGRPAQAPGTWAFPEIERAPWRVRCRRHASWIGSGRPMSHEPQTPADRPDDLRSLHRHVASLEARVRRRGRLVAGLGTLLLGLGV